MDIKPREPKGKSPKDKKEHERAYFDFDERRVRTWLGLLGAKHKGLYLFRSVIYIPPAGVKMVRVRDEGHRATMTVKRRTDSSEKNDDEDEVIIDDFVRGTEVMEALGLQKKYYAEKIRDIYYLRDAEVVFDTYPGLPPYMEVEGDTDEIVESAAQLLGLNPADPQDRGAGEMYLDLYGIMKDRPLTDLTFENVTMTHGQLIIKDRDEFEARIQEQRTIVAKLRR